jgi:hypothetical protein
LCSSKQSPNHMCSSFIPKYHCGFMLSSPNTSNFHISETFYAFKFTFELLANWLRKARRQPVITPSHRTSVFLLLLKTCLLATHILFRSTLLILIKPYQNATALLYVHHAYLRQTDKEDQGKSPPLSVFHAKLLILGISLKSRTTNK